MHMMLCPFCPSREPWNDCRCAGALYAQRHGMIAAKKQFAGQVAPKPSSVSMPKRKAATPKPRPAERIMEGLREALAIAKGEAEPARVVDVAPWLQPPGVCPSCDRRRATNADVARKRRATTKADTPSAELDPKP